MLGGGGGRTVATYCHVHLGSDARLARRLRRRGAAVAHCVDKITPAALF